jgi:hypothetical protein
VGFIIGHSFVSKFLDVSRHFYHKNSICA